MTNLGNKEIFSKNLRYYMERAGKDRNKVCEDLSISYTTFADWYNAIKYPRIDKIELLANYFGVQKSDLIEEINPSDYSCKAVKIPVLGFVRAGIPMTAVENIIDYEEISTVMANQGDYFGLKIKGDSMEPKFSNGDVVIVQKQSVVENGDIAVVLVNGNEATIKKFYRSPLGIQLIATNPSYEPMVFSPKEVDSLPVTIIGKVVELRAKF